MAEHHLSEAREEAHTARHHHSAVNLLNQIEVEALILELSVISSEGGMPLGIVIFDTFSRSTPGGNENAAEITTRAIGAADSIRDEFGAASLFVHHSERQRERRRGHSSLFAAADTVISVIERVATVEKSRDGTQGEQFRSGLEVVNLGEDADGDADNNVRRDSRRQWSNSEVKVGEAQPRRAGCARHIARGTQHDRALPQTSVIPPGTKAVRVDNWRMRFHARVGDTRELEQAAAVRRGTAAARALLRSM